MLLAVTERSETGPPDTFRHGRLTRCNIQLSLSAWPAQPNPRRSLLREVPFVSVEKASQLLLQSQGLGRVAADIALL